MSGGVPEGRWEHGSELHWMAWAPDAPRGTHPWAEAGRLYGSGRDAMRALLAHGCAQLGWRRLWLPDFFCQEVVHALATPGLTLAVYADGPADAEPRVAGLPLEPGDAVLVVNHFALRRPLTAPLPGGVALIEDHTHDPWSTWALQSRADFAVASLRKTLPVPDGGVLWSPRGLPLPDPVPVTPERELASLRKLAGSLLKGLYLEGHAVEKAAFRALQLGGEAQIASGEVSGMPPATEALLGAFPVPTWREARLANWSQLAAALEDCPGARVLRPADPTATPFSAFVVFDSRALRDHVRAHLVQNRVYPAILWTLDEPALPGLSPEAVDLAGRCLSVHVDARYQAPDLARVSALVHEACRQPSRPTEAA